MQLVTVKLLGNLPTVTFTLGRINMTSYTNKFVFSHELPLNMCCNHLHLPIQRVNSVNTDGESFHSVADLKNITL